MSKWSKMMSTVNKARDVGNKVKNVKGQYDKAKATINKVREDGIGNTLKEHLSKKARQRMRQMALHGAKAVFTFLVSNPIGWAISAGLIAIIIALGSVDWNGNTGLNGTSDNNKVTISQYAAMQTGCPIPTSMSVSGTGELKPGKTDWGNDAVAKFASSPLTSTWKISDDAAANYFLSRNSRVATKYGLNKSNIGRVTDAIKKEGVSPAFFYLYAVNEGGGEGGYINHYQAKDMSGEAVADAHQDAAYLVEEAKSVGGSPATGGGEPASLPTGPAEEWLKKLPAGSIGKVYIKATSAVTAEIADLAGQHGEWTKKFGMPISDIMTAINSLGGDVNASDQIAIATSSSAGGTDCDTTPGGSANLKSGGLTLEEARKFMIEKFKNVPITEADFPGAAPGSPDIHNNCTVFTAFFLHKYTTIKPNAGNGMDVVNNLLKANPQLKKSDVPTVYSAFSIGPGGGPGLAGDVGHTGIVLGIDTKRGKAILGQAGYNHPFTSIDSWYSGINAVEYDLSKMTAANGWSFTDVSKYVKGLNN